MFLPLTIPGIGEVKDPTSFAGGGIADVVNAALKYVYPFAGIITFFVLIAGGFQLLTSAGNAESTQKGYQKIVFAIIGFIFIFITFWIAQILELVLGIEIV